MTSSILTQPASKTLPVIPSSKPVGVDPTEFLEEHFVGMPEGLAIDLVVVSSDGTTRRLPVSLDGETDYVRSVIQECSAMGDAVSFSGVAHSPLKGRRVHEWIPALGVRVSVPLSDVEQTVLPGVQQPTLIIDAGSECVLIWTLSEPVEIMDAAGVERARAITRAMGDCVHALLGEHGANTRDPSPRWPLPGTRTSSGGLVRVVGTSGPVYDLADLIMLLEPAPAPAAPTASLAPAVSPTPDTSGIPPRFLLSDGRFLIPPTTDARAQMAQVLGAIARSAEAIDLFKRGGRLVKLAESAASAPAIKPIHRACLDEAVVAPIMQFGFPADKPGQEPKLIKTPRDVLDNLAWRPDFPGIRALESVSTIPPVGPDLTIHTTPGYISDRRIYYSPTVTIPAIPARPPSADIKTARAWLEDLQVDRPFASDGDRAAALALLFTLVLRSAIDGPTPLFSVWANEPRLGKTLWVRDCSLIAHGIEPEPQSYSGDDESIGKRLFVAAREARPILFWDNLRSGMKIGGPALDCVLTTRRLNDRVLGESKSESYQWDTVVVVSSNNPCYRGDTAPRTQPIGFRSDLEHPELRSGWRHPDLGGWVRQNRGQLLWAVLTIARGYAAAGMPDQRLPAWGSYEAYSKIVRGMLVWARYADPASVRVTDRDVEVDFVGNLLEGLRVADKDGAGLSTRQIIEKTQFGRNEVLSAALSAISPPNLMISPDSLGKHLSQHQGRNVGGWRIASRKKHGGVCVWFAERILSRAA